MIKQFRKYFIDEEEFRYINGEYVSITDDRVILADFLASIGIPFVDERTKMVRLELENNNQNLLFEFYDFGNKITCKLWNEKFANLQVQHSS